MKNTSFKQNSFETEVNCREKAMNFTNVPLRGSMMVCSGHYPHTKCLRRIGVPRLMSGGDASRPYDKVVKIREMCLRHNGVPRLMSGRGKQRIENRE